MTHPTISTLIATALLSTAALADDATSAPKIEIDAKKGTVVIPATFSKLRTGGEISHVLVSERVREAASLLTTTVKETVLEKALRDIGLEKGVPAGRRGRPAGVGVRVFVEHVPKGAKKPSRRPVDELISRKTVEANGEEAWTSLKPRPWIYTGSRLVEGKTPKTKRLLCERTGALIGLHDVDSSPLLQNPRDEARRQGRHRVSRDIRHPAGTRVKLIFERVLRKPPAGAVREHLFISGRVQGVSFRAFTRRAARAAKLTGWVLNLPDGRVEAVIEGPKADVESLIEKLHRGPRRARVDNLVREKETPLGAYSEFDIRYPES